LPVPERIRPDAIRAFVRFYTSGMERKLATVLFVDLVGSTALVTAADPEVVRRRVTQFFDQVSHCVTTHGGIVEKFAGDAVLAAFGVAQAHEDDAERAVRAGLAILEAVEKLELEARIGIESGEVLVDTTESTFATGEAVNLAARLQQAAMPGEILIGPAARSLTRGSLEVEEAEPVQVKGRIESLPAWRVVCADADRGRPMRSAIVAPLIGRESELELLMNTFDRTARDRRAHLVTIYGEPGVGKSRLAHEFVGSLEGATVLSGRCLPYGEGITYWALAEMVKSSAGISDDEPVAQAMEKLRACCEDEAVADLLGIASGVLEAVETDRSAQEIAWAAREWADLLASVQPLVLVFEDIHWAEDPLLELIEHLATRVREAPLLIVALARPELLDVRPGWGGGRLRATAVELDPLQAAESEQLIEALLPGDGLAPDARRDLLEKTEGNPLFVEETIRMLAESGGGYLPERIPDTLQALIAARIDHLPPAAKALLHRAAVIGRVFWHGALTHLAPGTDVDGALDDLLMRDFVLGEQRSTIIGERAYRFKHVLIREVAYGGLTKVERAELHARFAEWLHERAGEELLEIRAYHLDHATQLLVELDGFAPAELAREAAAALEEAGRRALAREANRSARKLLLRSVELEPTLERRYHAARAAWRLSDLPAVSVEMRQVLEEARKAGDSAVEGKALTALAEVTLLRDADLPKATALIDAALEALPAEGRFTALGVRGHIAYWVGDFETRERVGEEALEIARQLERKDLEAQALNELAMAHRQQNRLDSAEELLRRGLDLAEESGSIVARAEALHSLGLLRLDRGSAGEAEPLLEQARTLFAEVGDAWRQGRTMNELARAFEGQGDDTTAERWFREAIRLLKPLEDRGALCESQRGLAEVLIRRGRIDEAERVALEAIETVGEHDFSSRATTAMTLGLVRAAQGRDEDAETLLLEALTLVEETGFRGLEIFALSRLEQFLRERGRDADAARYRERLAELAPAAGLALAFADRIDRIT
jgi:class 3 adenylate cyclase/tetratricopeptide (TPR) repeat protein